MIRKHTLLYKLILLAVVTLLFSIGTASADIGDWTIDDNKVYVDDSKVYLSAEPHTLSESGFVYFTINPKTYSGDVDLYFGFNNGGMKPTRAYYNNNGEWVNIASYFNKINYDYDGFDTWYYSNNLPVNAGQTYELAVWMERPNEISFGKYGFGIKPSFQTLNQAIAAGNFYYLDPWWDSDWNYKIESNVSNPSFPYQMNLTVHSGAGTSNNTDVFLYNNANTNFTDIRFLLDDITELSYWIEDNTTDPIKVWINVTANGTVSLYYGNALATDTSNGFTTFDLFDDFEDGTLNPQWTANNNYNEADGFLKLYGTGSKTSSVKALIPSSVNPPCIVEFSFLLDTTSSLMMFSNRWDGNYESSYDEPLNAITGKYLKSTNTHIIEEYISGTTYTRASSSPSLNVDQWYEYKYIDTSTNINSNIIGTNQINVNDASDYGNYIGLFSRYLNEETWYDNIKIRKYLIIEPTWDTWSSQLPNTPPSVPIINSPINNTVFTDYLSGDVMFLNVSSTDVESNVITYHFYGDMVDGSTYLGQNDSIDGNTYNWSVSQYGNYYWKVYAADYMNDSSFTAIQQFTLIIPPHLTLPSNTSTTYVTYPPLTSDISFTWQDLAAPQYRLMVAEDYNFNVMAVDTHVGTNNSEQSLLVNKEYYWKVYTYDGSTYSDSSEVYRFNLTGNSTLTGSAIEGVVYQANGAITAISGAEVTIWNSTWSSSMITGSNGYYVFEDLNSGTVYNLQAKSDRYWDSSIALVNTTSDPVTNNFYLIDDLTDTEWWHYVEFTVQNVWGVTYPNVATKVYIGDSPTVSDSGNTESDGTISFHLNQNVQYHITFINATLGINEDITLYPVATSYKVYIDSYSFDIPNIATDDIQAYIVSSRINATYGYINFTWSDTSDLTTLIDYSISDVDGNVLYSTSTSSSDMFNSQVVTATDDRYIVRYIGVHPTHGTIDKTETIVFHGGRRVDLGWGSDWQYAVTALAFLIFFGALFGAKTAQYGGVTVVMLAWFFKWIGWLDNSNTSTLLLILATVIAFGWVLRKSEEVKT